MPNEALSGLSELVKGLQKTGVNKSDLTGLLNMVDGFISKKESVLPPISVVQPPTYGLNNIQQIRAIMNNNVTKPVSYEDLDSKINVLLVGLLEDLMHLGVTDTVVGVVRSNMMKLFTLTPKSKFDSFAICKSTEALLTQVEAMIAGKMNERRSQAS